MNKIIGVALLLVATSAIAATGFLTRQEVSGTNRICFYNHMGSTVVITIRVMEQCPLTIQR